MTTKTATDWQILTDAHRALRSAVLGVAPRDWNRATPCAQWNVTQVLQHAVGDQLGYASAITGAPGPSEDPFAPSGQLNEAPLTTVDHAVHASASAWATIRADARDVPNPLPQGPMPAWLAVGACALDAAVHAWDIAVASGQSSPLPPGLARPLMATNVMP